MSAFNDNSEDRITFQTLQNEAQKHTQHATKEICLLNQKLLIVIRQLLQVNQSLVSKLQIEESKTIH